MAKQTTRSPFRTTPGSYEAPVEGIVDYGAFQRGFDSSFIVPQPEEQIDPLVYEKQNAIYVKNEDVTTDDMVFNTNIADQVNNGIAVYTKKINGRLNELASGGKPNQQAVNNEIQNYGNFKQQITNFQGFNAAILDAEEIIDRRLTKNITFGKKSNGETISVLDFYNRKNQGENSYAGISSSLDRNDRLIVNLNSNGFEVNLNNLSAENASDFYIARSDLNGILKEFEATPEGKATNINSVHRSTTTAQSTYDLAGGDRQQTGTTTTGAIREDVYTEIDTASKNYGKSLTSKEYNHQYNSLYVDILFGTDNEKNFDNQVSGGYIDAFKDGKFVASDGTGYSFEQFKNEFFKKDGSIPSYVKDELVRQYGSDYYKINSGSGHHVDKGNGHAGRVDDVVTQKTSTENKIESSGLSFNFGGVGVDETLYNAISETDKYGRSDDIAGTLFFTKNLTTGDNQNPTFDQQMLVSVNPSASGTGTKQVIFNLNKGKDGYDPKFIVYDFGYSMAQDAPKVYLDKEGEVVKKGSKGAIEVIPKTAQEYVQSRFSTKADQKKYSKTINDVYDTRKKNYAKENFIENYMSKNNATRETAEAAYDIEQIMNK